MFKVHYPAWKIASPKDTIPGGISLSHCGAHETGIWLLPSPGRWWGPGSAHSNGMLTFSLNECTGDLSDAPSHVSRAVPHLKSWALWLIPHISRSSVITSATGQELFWLHHSLWLSKGESEKLFKHAACALPVQQRISWKPFIFFNDIIMYALFCFSSLLSTFLSRGPSGLTGVRGKMVMIRLYTCVLVGIWCGRNIIRILN